MKRFGIYRAIVETNLDPLGMGRFAVRLQQPLDTDTAELMWVTYTSELAGSTFDGIGAGFFMPPRKGHVVLIAFEHGDVQAPVYLKSVYVPNQSSRNSVPNEAYDTSQESLNRVITTDVGNKFELDDRKYTSTGAPTRGIRLTSSGGKYLELGDGTKQVVLSSGTLGHELIMQPNYLKLSTKNGQGLYISENALGERGIRLRAINNDDLGLVLGDGIAKLSTTNSVSLEAAKRLQLIGESNIDMETINYQLNAGGSIGMFSGGGVNIGALDKFTVMAVNNVEFNIAQTGNYVVKMQTPGTPLQSGNYQVETSLGNITMKVGQPLLSTTSPGFVVSTPDVGDTTSTARISLGGVTGGAVTIEGSFGGLYISPVPIVIPGSSSPVKILQPGASPVPTQPIVLGTNLQLFMTNLLTNLSTYFSQFLIAAPTIATSPVGPCIANPALITAIGKIQGELASQIALLNAVNSGGFLSQITFAS